MAMSQAVLLVCWLSHLNSSWRFRDTFVNEGWKKESVGAGRKEEESMSSN